MINGGKVLARSDVNYRLIIALPYITLTPFRPYRKCEAWTGGSYNPQLCTKRAEFTYKEGKTKKAHVPTLHLCWTHLFTHAIFYKVYEKDRAERAWAKMEKKENSGS